MQKNNQKPTKPAGETRSGFVNLKTDFLLKDDLIVEPTERAINGLLQSDKKEWIRFYDRKNEFYKGLIALINNSHTLNGIINKKTTFCLGDGLMFSEIGAGMKEQQITDLSKIKEINGLINTVNLFGESLMDVLCKVFYDYNCFGNSFLEIVKTKNLKGQPVVYLYHHQINNIAIQKAGNDRIIKEVGICNSWDSKARLDNNENVTTLPLYPVFIKEKSTERSIIHLKKYSPEFMYYGLPEWIACKLYAELEYRIPRYNVSKINNGYVPSAIVQFVGNSSEEEAQQLLSSFKNQFTGNGNNNKLFVQVVQDEKYKANVQTLTDNNQMSYKDLAELAAKAIVNANSWSWSLAGYSESGSLGSNQQVRTEFDIINNTIIKPIQNLVISKVIKPYLSECSELLNKDYLSLLNVKISNSAPVSFSGDLNVANVLTNNEQREILGYEPLNTNNNATT